MSLKLEVGIRNMSANFRPRSFSFFFSFAADLGTFFNSVEGWRWPRFSNNPMSTPSNPSMAITSSDCSWGSSGKVKSAQASFSFMIDSLSSGFFVQQTRQITVKKIIARGNHGEDAARFSFDRVAGMGNRGVVVRGIPFPQANRFLAIDKVAFALDHVVELLPRMRFQRHPPTR